MKTIVVPIDFSPASVNAANYAVDFAIAIKASVSLVHVCDYGIIGDVPITAESITELNENSQKNISALKEGLDHKTSNKINISTDIREGSITNQLKQYCQEKQPVVVIMGTHGTNAAERALFGSNTLSAMRNLIWPLIIVPTGTRFTGITRIGLACDLRDVHLTVRAEEINFLFSEFHPQLHVLHITEKKHGMLADDEIKEVELLKEILKQNNPVFHFMQSKNMEEAINEFSEKNNLNLLIVIPKFHGLFDSLFHKSHSKEMVLHAHIPVMSVHE